MVDARRKGRSTEVRWNIEAQGLQQPEESVAVDIRVHGGEVVRARLEVEGGGRWFGRRSYGRRLHVHDLDELTHEGLRARDRRVEAG